MGYLNNTGLQRFWDGIKSKFVRTVNGVAPDANGNVQVSGGSGSAIGNRGIFYGTCDTVAATVEKAVVCPDFAANDLVAGTVVMVLFGVTNSGAVASITLNVNSTGAKSIKYISNGSYANIPNAGYLKANQIYQFTFDGTYWVVEMNYDTNNNAYRMYMADAKLATFTNLYRYMVCFTKDATTILPVNAVSNNVNTGKQLTTELFDPFGPIWYYNATSTVNAGAKAGSLYYFCNTVDLRYSFNTAKTLTASKNVYIVCNPYGDKVKLDPTNPISQDLPSTDDGKLYILLGVAYDTYRVSIHPNHPIYYYKKDSIREWTNSGDVIKFASPGDVAEENRVLSYDGSWKPIGSIVIEISPTWSGNSAFGNLTSEKDFTYINEAINAGNNVTILANKGTDRIIFHSVHYEPETGPVEYAKDICFRSITDGYGYYELKRTGITAVAYSIRYARINGEIATTLERIDSRRLRIRLRGVELCGTPVIYVMKCDGRKRARYSWRHPDDFNYDLTDEMLEESRWNEIFKPYGFWNLTYHAYAYDTDHYDDYGEMFGQPYPSWYPYDTRVYNNMEYKSYGCLKTVFGLTDATDSDERGEYFDIDLRQWIKPALKPIRDFDNDTISWSKCGLVGVCRDRAPVLFKFYLADYHDGAYDIIGEAEGILAVGVSKRAKFIGTGSSQDHYSLSGVYTSIR